MTLPFRRIFNSGPLLKSMLVAWALVLPCGCGRKSPGDGDRGSSAQAGVTRVAIIANPEHPGEHQERAYSERRAEQLSIGIDYHPTRSTEELEAALRNIAADPPQAISLFADGFAIQNRERIIQFGLSHKIPVISGWPVFAQSGAICTYGPRLTESYRRMASFVDRILKGNRPAEMPIERPTQFQLIINLRTAKALGITVPPTLLARADEVIE